MISDIQLVSLICNIYKKSWYFFKLFSIQISEFSKIHIFSIIQMSNLLPHFFILYCYHFYLSFHIRFVTEMPLFSIFIPRFQLLIHRKKSKNIPLYLWRGHALCQFQNFDNSLMALMDLKEWLVNNVMSCQIVLNSSYRNTVVSTSTS